MSTHSADNDEHRAISTDPEGDRARHDKWLAQSAENDALLRERLSTLVDEWEALGRSPDHSAAFSIYRANAMKLRALLDECPTPPAKTGADR